MYDKIFITNLASFYKVNLFNGLNKKKKILVIYTMETSKTRNEDFFSDKHEFDCLFLRGSLFEKIKTLRKIVKMNPSTEVILGGWDNIEAWFTIFINSKLYNSCIVESSVYESEYTGIKGLLKKIYLARISKVYVPGKSNEALIKNLNFKGDIIRTGGVGIMNFQTQPPFVNRDSVKNFLYVGRLVDVKNLRLLIECFNELPGLNLNIIGFGDQEDELKVIAKQNTNFLGPVDNIRLPDYYKGNDVFVLPSKSESWGLVVEEALNNGIPVIVSDKVGCKDDLVTSETGLVFHFNDKKDLQEKIKKIMDVDFYNSLRKNISFLNFEDRMNMQISAFV